MTNDEYKQLSAVEIAAKVRSGAVSASETVKACFGVLKATEPAIHAFATIDEAGALAAAAKIDADIAVGRAVGPLAGVPVAIKDLVLTKGLRTTFGSRLYENFVPEDDDIVVERLKAAGAIVIGKSNASEFGFGAHGRNLLFAPTCNPWDLSRTPGGSSAGSAAAVAAGVCPIAIGSDGGGSIRIPAAFSGLFGIKPSMGRVAVWPGCRDERYPGVSSWESLEHLGPITRTVADAALMLSVIASPDPRDRHSIPNEIDWLAEPVHRSGLRVAYWPQWGDRPIEPAVRQTIDAAVERYCAEAGHPIVVGRPPELDLGPAFQALIALDTDLTGFRALVKDKGVLVTPAVEKLLAKSFSFEDATDALTMRKAFSNAMARVMADCDILLTPTVPIVAFAADADGPGSIDGVAVGPTGWSPFTSPFNLTGQPAASIPCGLVDGLPVGLQIVGPHLGDTIVMEVAAAFEAVHPAARCGFHA